MKRLYRADKNQVIGGVCAGIAEYFDIDPTIVRVIFVALVLGEGFGVLLYLILWVLLPTKSSLEDDQSETIQKNKEEIKTVIKKTAKEIKKEVKTDTAKKNK
ncbi:PspC domain-containing protein [bacterium]|nr:PspC domain-containing protein [bacterium]